MASLQGSQVSHVDQTPPERDDLLPLAVQERHTGARDTGEETPGHRPHARVSISKSRRQASFMPTAQELDDKPEAPRITNVMSGPRYPIGQVLAWMGCMVWNFDILLNPTTTLQRRKPGKTFLRKQKTHMLPHPDQRAALTQEPDKFADQTSQEEAHPNYDHRHTRWDCL